MAGKSTDAAVLLESDEVAYSSDAVVLSESDQAAYSLDAVPALTASGLELIGERCEASTGH